MKAPFISKEQVVLLLGDAVTLAFVTVAGFARHGELGSSGLRLFTTYLPLLAAWLLVSPFLGAFGPENVREARQLWRPFWAMVLAGPFATFLRAAWLGSAADPDFTVIIGGISALSLLAWRGIYLLFEMRNRKKLSYG